MHKNSSFIDLKYMYEKLKEERQLNDFKRLREKKDSKVVLNRSEFDTLVDFFATYYWEGFVLTSGILNSRALENLIVIFKRFDQELSHRLNDQDLTFTLPLDEVITLYEILEFVKNSHEDSVSERLLKERLAPKGLHCGLDKMSKSE